MENLVGGAEDGRGKDRTLIDFAVPALVPAAEWSIGPVGQGFQARVYRIDWVGPHGRAGCLAARVSEDAKDLLREHGICRDILPSLGIRAPRVLGFFEQGGVSSSFREFIDGAPPWEVDRPDFGSALELMAAFHHNDVTVAPAEWNALCADYSAGRLTNAFDELNRAVASAHPCGPDFGWLTPSFRRLADFLLRRADSVVREIAQVRRSFVHGDAVPGNFLFSPSGGSPMLMDWDQFGVYVPHVDVLSALYHHSDEERGPLIAGYLETRRRLSGSPPDERDFRHVLDLVDIQRSAEIVGFWLGRVLAQKVDPERVTGFLSRRVAAIESASSKLGLVGP